jgi:electron transfer flavoprotein alpha subunit
VTGGAVDEAAVAVVVARDGRLPAGGAEAVAEASGRAVVVGGGARDAALDLTGAVRAWWMESPTGPAGLAGRLSAPLARTSLLILPASPDGRDLAPRLAVAMGRPLLAGAVACSVVEGVPHADLLRVDGRVVLPAVCSGPAVATLLPGSRPALPDGGPPQLIPLPDADVMGNMKDAETLDLIEPEPATMDLSEARRVFGGGAGLVRPGSSPAADRAIFSLLCAVAAALGASAGATRVVTDAGWMDYDRQIGTTGVAIDPDLYVALGVSGASQHVGGLGSPKLTISVNTDASCPMTAMADLGLVADAPSVLLELARRLEVPIPHELAEVMPL